MQQHATEANQSVNSKSVQFRNISDLNTAYSIYLKNVSNEKTPYYLIVKTPEYKASRYILEQKKQFKEIDSDIVDKLQKEHAVTIQLTNNLESDINLASLYINLTLIRNNIRIDSLSAREPLYELETLFQPGSYKVFLESETNKVKPISKLIPVSFNLFKNSKTLTN
jgi:hypothetical protein